jgi:hypothetical protein
MWQHKENTNPFRFSDAKPERERSLERPRHRYEDNIKVDLKEILYKRVGWIHLTQDWSSCRGMSNSIMSH